MEDIYYFVYVNILFMKCYLILLKLNTLCCISEYHTFRHSELLVFNRILGKNLAIYLNSVRQAIFIFKYWETKTLTTYCQNKIIAKNKVAKIKYIEQTDF